MRRVQVRIQEMFQGKIDMADIPNDTNGHFETRALAAFALIMTSGLEVSQASAHVTDGYHDMGIDAIYLDETQKNYLLFKVNGDQTEVVPLLKTKCLILFKEFREYWKRIWQVQMQK